MNITGIAIAFGAPDRNGRIFEKGCITPKENVPVILDFKHGKVVGKASVRADATVVVDLSKGVEVANPNRLDPEIGFRVVRERVDGDMRFIEEIEIITIGLVERNWP